MPKIFTLNLSTTASKNKLAVDILDRSGIDYRVVEAPNPSASHAARPPADEDRNLPRVEYGAAQITDFTRQQLIDFLWAHGAKFEDS